MNFGPQVNIGVPPGIMNESSSNPANQSWQGLTIKEILEKVDLSNIIMDEDKKKVVSVFITIKFCFLNLLVNSICVKYVLMFSRTSSAIRA